MKKILSVLLVLILAFGSVFAADATITGAVETGLKYDFSDDSYGFYTNLTNSEVTLTLGSASVDTTPVVEEPAEGEEAVEAPSLYAVVKASLSASAKIGSDVVDASGSHLDSETTWTEWTGEENGSKTTTSYNLYYDFAITEAKVGGADWSVSLLGVSDAPAFASSWLDLDEDGNSDDVAIPYFGDSAGVEAKYLGYTLGFGFQGQKGKGTSASAYFATPEYQIIDGLTVSAAGVYSHRSALDKEDATPNYGAFWVWDNDKNAFVLDYKKDKVDAVDADAHNIGGSVKVAYATDVFGVSLAADGAVKNIKKGPDFLMDARLTANYTSLVTFDAYYGLNAKDDDGVKANRVDLQVKTDLNELSIPVSLTLGLQDLAADARAFTASVTGGYAGVTATFGTEVALSADPDWKISGEIAYDILGYADVKASVSYDKAKNLGASVSVESDSIIPGATFGIGWYDAADLLQKNDGKEVNDTYWASEYTPASDGWGSYNEDTGTKNLYKDGKVAKDLLKADHSDFGVIKAFCKIAF